MPPSHLPPTPASSTDIRGKEKLVPLAPALSLPPSAYGEASDRAASSTPSNYASDSSYNPNSPISPENVRRKPSVAAPARPAKADDAFALPPPPTRNRKIIQMKPKTAAAAAAAAAASEKADAEEVEAASAKAGNGAGGKKRGGNAGTAASRKVARKTAHSLIERRRRSKMNEEFGVLKDMIPACKGQEMHKLAILQASIEYLRYLERCVSDLKATGNANRQAPAAPSPTNPEATLPPTQPDEPMNHTATTTTVAAAPAADDDDDEEMSDSHPQTGASTPHNLSQIMSREPQPSQQHNLPSISHFSQTTSPAMPALDSSRHYSISSASAPSFSPYIHSNQASPFFAATSANQDPAPFALTSPALLPQDSRHLPEDARIRERREKELDHEAMAALLMLNSDRRGWNKARGMSVQDLLSN